jgi:hypothetical protein
MMSVPKETVPPKPRSELWKETIIGFVCFIFGLVLIWQYTMHTGHEHALDTSVLYVGVGSSFYGLWMTNKKLAKEFMAEVRKFSPFAKNKGGE